MSNGFADGRGRHSEAFEKDQLFHGLPCVWDGDVFLIFSPYSQKIAHVPSNLLNATTTMQQLSEQKFFDQPHRPSKSFATTRFGLVLTTGCNLRCKYCYVVPDAKPRMMTPEYAIRVIKENITAKTEKISLSFFGGEATLNMQALKAAVEHVQRLEIPSQFIINTNGTMSEAELDYLIANNFIFSVSSDGVPSTTDFQRPTVANLSVSELVERTIRRLVEAEAIFQVRPTMTTFNCLRFVDAIQYWKNLGTRFVHFEPVGSSRIMDEPLLSPPEPDEYVTAIKKGLDEAERLRMWMISSPYMNLLTPSSYFCTLVAGEKEMYTPDGAISACYRVEEKNHPINEFIIGEYDLATDTFVRKEDRIRRFKQIEVSPDGHCATCHARYICAGGCPFRNLKETGSMLGIDSWSCYVKKALVHDAIIRIDVGIERDQIPVVFGESVFESLVAKSFTKYERTL